MIKGIMVHSLIGWFLMFGGNCFYRLNGGLEGLHNDGIFSRLTIWFWSNSYWHYDASIGIVEDV